MKSTTVPGAIRRLHDARSPFCALPADDRLKTEDVRQSRKALLTGDEEAGK